MSDDNEMKIGEEKEEKTFLTLVLKKDTTKWNVFAMFYTFFIMTTMGGYINV